jgi:hypothetical protein
MRNEVLRKRAATAVAIDPGVFIMAQSGRSAGVRDLGAIESPLAQPRMDELTDAVYEGLDLQREINAVEAQGLGDTVLV